jgi:O-antigen/teichoic acid export membrane protein
MPSTLANIGDNSIAKLITMAVVAVTSAILARNLGAKVKWRLDRNIARQLVRFGLPLSLSGLLVFLVFNIDNFVIGSGSMPDSLQS